MHRQDKMSNNTARKYFMHDNDVSHKTDEPSCYFSQRGNEEGWGFWVGKDGSITVDEDSANGTLPSPRTIEACRVSAKKWLSKEKLLNPLASS